MKKSYNVPEFKINKEEAAVLSAANQGVKNVDYSQYINRAFKIIQSSAKNGYYESQLDILLMLNNIDLKHEAFIREKVIEAIKNEGFSVDETEFETKVSWAN